MKPPDFFEAAPRIVVRDALAELLGAADGGLIEYRYADAVKLAGHSCPTVAGAWLMTRAALRRLYGDELPRRGEIRVDSREPLDAGVAGVVASVATLITGASGEGGFKGLGGRHARRGLLHFGVPMAGELRFTRQDSGAAVEVAQRGGVVPRPPRLAECLQAALAPGAGPEARAEFGRTWQDWVRTLLVDHADDPELIAVID
ncbi:MAG TPA: hypothetical protein VLU41_13070 [Ideonella sp.]|nr:hypothetical protein [Ideonella sp.]